MHRELTGLEDSTEPRVNMIAGWSSRSKLCAHQALVVPLHGTGCLIHIHIRQGKGDAFSMQVYRKYYRRDGQLLADAVVILDCVMGGSITDGGTMVVFSFPLLFGVFMDRSGRFLVQKFIFPNDNLGKVYIAFRSCMHCFIWAFAIFCQGFRFFEFGSVQFLEVLIFTCKQCTWNYLNSFAIIRGGSSFLLAIRVHFYFATAAHTYPFNLFGVFFRVHRSFLVHPSPSRWRFNFFFLGRSCADGRY